MEGVDNCTNFKVGDKTECCNYTGISILSTTYKILSNILLSRLTPHADKIIGDQQYELQHNRSTTDPLSCILQIFKNGITMKQNISYL